MYYTHHSCGGLRGGRYRTSHAHLSSWVHRCLAFLGGAILVLATVSGACANGLDPQFVEAVETTSEADQLEVRVMTTSPEPPAFSAFPLREPDRLVMDFRDYLWQPGRTGHLESAHPQVECVRVGQFSKEPPITRVVLDLRVPASEVKYEADRSGGHGELSIRVSPPSGERIPPSPASSSSGAASAKPAGARIAAAAGGPKPTKRSSGREQPDPFGAAAASTAAQAKPGTGKPVAGATPPSPPDTSVTSAGVEPPKGTGAAAGVAPRPAERPGAQPRGAGPAATAPAGPPPAAQAAAVSWKDYLTRGLAAVAVIILIGALAVWLRKRVGTPGRAAAQSEAAKPAIGETVPLPDSAQDLPREAVAPAAEPTEAAIRCRIVDGYLLLAPEGGEAALSRLGSGGARKAKVEGSISLTPVEEDEEDETIVEALAEEESPAVEGRVAEEEAGAEAVPEEELISAAALAAGEGMVDEPTLEDTEDLPARARELVESLGDEDDDARRQAAEGLWGLAESGHVELLAPYLDSEDARVRLVIAGVLGESRAAEFAGQLAGLTDDPDPSVRATVFYAFSQLGQAAGEHVDAVRKGLSDEEGSVRARAVEALAAMAPDDDEVAAQVIALTGDPEFAVREAATSAALNFARNGVTEPLVALLADLGRRAQALELLQQAEADVIKQLLAAAAKAASESSTAAMGTLSYVVGTRCTPADFSADLQSSDPEVRLAGLEGLAIVGGEESRADLVKMSEGDASPQVRERAAEILTYWDEMAESTARAGADSAGSST